MALVNQVGHSKRSLVYDMTYDYEVWNQPIQSYEYTYFNPMSRTAVSSLSEAMVDYRYFRSRDVFAGYRKQTPAYVVGIVLKVVYVGETSPDNSETDSADSDHRVVMKYFYDLELDANGVIIGGEWYQRAHPDFMWTYAPNQRAYTGGDEALGNAQGWDSSKPLPTYWRQAAQASSRQESAPLGKIVEHLIKLSNGRGN
jgi:hypothetical protein